MTKDKVVYIDKFDNPGGLSLATYIGFGTDLHPAAGCERRGKPIIFIFGAE